MNEKQDSTKRRRGGQPGNLNSARSCLPAIARLGDGKPLPRDLARIVTIAEQEKQELTSDKGGWDVMGGAERLMVSVWASARKAELLIWAELIDRGAVQAKEDGTWDLQPGVQRLSPFLAAQHRALIALGLKRRENPVYTLEDYMEKKYSNKERSNDKKTE